MSTRGRPDPSVSRTRSPDSSRLVTGPLLSPRPRRRTPRAQCEPTRSLRTRSLTPDRSVKERRRPPFFALTACEPRHMFGESTHDRMAHTLSTSGARIVHPPHPLPRQLEGEPDDPHAPAFRPTPPPLEAHPRGRERHRPAGRLWRGWGRGEIVLGQQRRGRGRGG